jgi:hypothetical protein
MMEGPMETRRLIEDRIEQYRLLIRSTLDRASLDVLRKQIEVEVAKLDRLDYVEAESKRNRAVPLQHLRNAF